jgi:hypothetical protein
MDSLFADTGSCVRAAASVFERAPVRAISESADDGDDEWGGLVAGKALG